MWTGNSRNAIIDVCIVTHNQAPWLEKCVDSVVNQTFDRPYNIFIFDDCSNKVSMVASERGCFHFEKSEPPRSVLYRLQKRGLAVTMNKSNLGCIGARMAVAALGSAPFLLFVDGDDSINEEFLDRVWRMANVKQADVVYPSIAIVTSGMAAVQGKLEQREYSLKSLLRKNYIPVTSLIRRSMFDRVGGFDKDFSFGFEDWALWLAMGGLRATFAWEPKATLFYLQHAGARSVEANKKYPEFRALAKEKFAALIGKPIIEEI